MSKSEKLYKTVNDLKTLRTTLQTLGNPQINIAKNQKPIKLLKNIKKPNKNLTKHTKYL